MRPGEQNANLPREEIADLERWWCVRFGSPAASEAALERYRRELGRQQAAWRAAGLGS